MPPKQPQKLLTEIAATVGFIGVIYGAWVASRAAFGFDDKSVGEVITELRAEDRRDFTRDSLSIVERTSIRSLTEANTLMLCYMVDTSLKHNSLLPCKRLLRERGLE